jgi:UTP--glucose-1-phosphate uridylyltransferase
MFDFEQIENIMLGDGLDGEQVSLFRKLMDQYTLQQERPIKWHDLSTPPDKSIIGYESLKDVAHDRARSLLSKLAVCRLNGGLGTSMGCVGPKSAIEVKNGQNFLDLIVQKIGLLNAKYSTAVPLVLMNSFSTDLDTQKIIKRYSSRLQILTFQQNQLPRLRRDTMLPLSSEEFGEQSCYPPGHGDFYDSFAKSGTLDMLIDQGTEYLFISNVDNIAASIDLKILQLMEETGAPFIMEVTEKTRADIKGGTLVKTGAQEMGLLELAQVPKAYKEEFKSIKKFKIFNTNNIWIDLKALKEKTLANDIHLDIIVNQKNLDHLPIIQLETAIGSGISNFEGSLAVKVPRIRFLPIKKTDDLLLAQSNLFVFEDGMLIKNPERQFDGLPLIRLGENFQMFEEYQKRFESIPDILELDLLTVVGNVYFGKNITLRGNVILICEGEELRIPDNAMLENKVLTGSIKMGEL